MGSQFLFIFLPYIAVVIFILGILYRFWVWIRIPVPLRIVTTPAPKTRWGVACRLIGDLLWFPTLFKSDKTLWAIGLLFHMSLWIILLRHLRYFLYPVPKWVEGIQTLGLYAGYLFPLAVIFLLARRLLIDQVLYISLLGDYFSLFLLLTLSISGILLQVFFRTYVIDIKAWFFGLVHFQPQIPKVHWLFLVHLISFLLLIIYFPFSKLIHSGGLLLSPTRYQRATFIKRHVNPWDYPVGYNPGNLSPPEGYAQAISGNRKGERE